MIKSEQNTNEFRLIDFGLAVTGKKVKGVAGNPIYLAPEVLTDGK